MKVNKVDILLAEVPGEISLGIYACGCSNYCKGCHSPELWDLNNGKKLTFFNLLGYLDEYRDEITCVVFMGGEWDSDFIKMLKIIRACDIKTCLYTGKEDVSDEIKHYLNYLKVGPYDESKGGLESATTNQIFYDLDNNVILNNKFLKKNV